MQKNNFNRVGLGTFPLTGVFNEISSEKAEEIVKKFIDLGGHFIDAAPLYGNGQIESLLGRALKNVPREKFYLITKTIKHADENGNYFMSGKYEDIIRQFDNSLQRLRLDFVDQLMIHQPDPNVPIEETLQAMEKLQDDGKVKDLAVSNVFLDELKKYNQTGKIRYVENRFSLINRSLSPEMEKYLLENKINLLPYHLLEIGALTGSSIEGFHLREGDRRNTKHYWNEENQAVISEWIKIAISPIAQKINVTIGQLAIAWALSQPYIDFVIVGTTKEEYLKINLNADKIVLSKETLEEIENAYQSLVTTVFEKSGKTLKDFRGLNEKYY